MNESTSAESAAPPSAEGTAAEANEKTENSGAEAKKKKGPPKHLQEVKEVIQQLIVAEKNYNLYPPYGKVVAHSLKKLHEAVEKFHYASGQPLHLFIGQKDLFYEEASVYHEEHTGKSLAYRLYKDGVRGIVIVEEVPEKELSDFLECFKEQRKVDEEEDDFGTLFWEKDCASVQLQLVDDTETGSEDEVPQIPTDFSFFARRFNREMVGLTEETEEELRDDLMARIESEGDSTFELTAEEAQKIRELALQEEEYFPVFDFVDILVEVMVRKDDDKAFKEAVKLIRSIVFALVENLDFDHAAKLMRKLTTDAHPGLTEDQRAQIRHLVGSFCDRHTLEVLDNFLEESPKLPKTHSLFHFMRLFDRQAVPHFCKFLRFHKQIPALCDVLLAIGRNCGATYAKLLKDPDPQVARAMVSLLLETDKKKGLVRIAAGIHHPDESVRKAAAQALLTNGGEAIADRLLPLLKEKSNFLLNLALEFFGRHTIPAAWKELSALIRSRKFLDLDTPRQAMSFRALMRANPEKAKAYIFGSVLRLGFCLTKGARQRKVAALIAIGDYPGPKVREALERFSLATGPLAEAANAGLTKLERAEAEEDGILVPHLDNEEVVSEH